MTIFGKRTRYFRWTCRFCRQRWTVEIPHDPKGASDRRDCEGVSICPKCLDAADTSRAGGMQRRRRIAGLTEAT